MKSAQHEAIISSEVVAPQTPETTSLLYPRLAVQWRYIDSGVDRENASGTLRPTMARLLCRLDLCTRPDRNSSKSAATAAGLLTYWRVLDDGRASRLSEVTFCTVNEIHKGSFIHVDCLSRVDGLSGCEANGVQVETFQIRSCASPASSGSDLSTRRLFSVTLDGTTGRLRYVYCSLLEHLGLKGGGFDPPQSADMDLLAQCHPWPVQPAAKLIAPVT